MRNADIISSNGGRAGEARDARDARDARQDARQDADPANPVEPTTLKDSRMKKKRFKKDGKKR